MDWDQIRVFQCVAEEGSLTRAGETLRMSQSKVSRQIKALEQSLGATLFHRHARGLIPTEQGEVLLEAARAMSKGLAYASARIRDAKDEAVGNLRITTTMGFGMMWLTPRLHRLYAKRPGLSIELMLEERILDLAMREADVAIRVKEPSQADLIRKRLMTVDMRLYACAGYLERTPAPESMEGLRGHRLIRQNPKAPQSTPSVQILEMLEGVGVASMLTVNSYFAVLQCVLRNLGIGVLPNYLSVDFPELVPVLPEIRSPEIPVYLAYPTELRGSGRVAAFREFVEREIAESGLGEAAD